MQVFKTFFKVLWQQRLTMFIYLIVFLVLEVMMASNGAEDSKSVYTQKSYHITVFDEDGSDISKGLVSYMEKENELITCEDDPEFLQDELYARDIVACIRIPAGYSDLFEKGDGENAIEITSIPGTIYESVISNQVNQYISCLNSYVAAGYSLSDALSSTADTMDIDAKVSLYGNYANGQKSATYYFYAYVPYILICISLVGIGACLIVFNRKELKSRTECSSFPLMKKNINLLLASVVAEIFILCLFLLLGIVLYREKMFTTSGLLFMLNAFCFSTVALSITYLIGLFARDRNILNMFGNVLGLSLSFLGGIFVSLDLFSDTMVNIAHFMPTYWYVIACDTIEKGSFSPENNSLLLTCYLIQLLFAAALVAVTLVITKLQSKEK